MWLFPVESFLTGIYKAWLSQATRTAQSWHSPSLCMSLFLIPAGTLMNYSSLDVEFSLSRFKAGFWCTGWLYRLLLWLLSESNHNTPFVLNEMLSHYLCLSTSIKSSYSSSTGQVVYWLFSSNKSVNVCTKLCLPCRLDFFFSALRCHITHEPMKHKCSFCTPPT